MKVAAVVVVAASVALGASSLAIGQSTHPAPNIPITTTTANPTAPPQTHAPITVRPGILVPVITAITPNRSAPGRVVFIDGEHFTGPRERGFNDAFFGATKAMGVTISKTRLRVVVPHLPVGPVRVIVRTQDGTSKPMDFEVERDPIEFWK